MEYFHRVGWTLQAARGCCLIMTVAIVLAVLGTCTAFGWQLGRVRAAPLPQATPVRTLIPTDICVILDQSDSNWTFGGIGSDPHLLRMAATRLLALRLGTESTWQTRLSLVYFGTEARLILPLAPLGQTEVQRRLDTLDPPPRMGWTDVRRAVELAETELYHSPRADPTTRKVILLITDGRPETPYLGQPDRLNRYLDDLEAQVDRLTQAGTQVYTILLRNAVTDADPVLERIYRPFWTRLVERGRSVRFYNVGAAEDLAPTVHDIAILLGAGISRSALVNMPVTPGMRVDVPVAAGWQQATFTIMRRPVTLPISLVRADGVPLTDDQPDVVHQRAPTSGLDVWRVERPMVGNWSFHADGEGMLTIWLDYVPLPPTPTASPQSATATPSPAPQPSVSPTPAIPMIPPSISLPLETPIPDAPVPSTTVSPLPGGLWVLPGLGLGAIALWWWRRRQPIVWDGVMRLLGGPNGSHRQTWRLAGRRNERLSIGGPSAGAIVLPGIAPGFTLAWLTRRPDGETWVKQGAAQLLRVNGVTVVAEMRLTGWDTLELDGWTVRYENLRERASQQRRTKRTA